MPYLNVVIDWFEDWDFRDDDIAEDVLEEMEDEWKPNNRFTIPQLLGENLPDFVIWIQERIDEEQIDETDIIVDIDREREREATEIELLQTRKELLELEIEEVQSQQGIVGRVVGFFRNALSL